MYVWYILLAASCKHLGRLLQRSYQCQFVSPDGQCQCNFWQIYVTASKTYSLEDRIKQLEAKVEQTDDNTSTRRMLELEDEVTQVVAETTQHQQEVGNGSAVESRLKVSCSGRVEACWSGMTMSTLSNKWHNVFLTAAFFHFICYSQTCLQWPFNGWSKSGHSGGHLSRLNWILMCPQSPLY